MASPGPTSSPPLPTREQCFSLSEAQCHKILMHRDPNNGRANKNWELVHQPELVRLYMTMISFPQIRDAMKQKLDYCYKTYANRYKDWHLPVDRSEREQTVRELFSLVSDSTNYHQNGSSTSLNSSRLPIRNLQPQPNNESPSTSQRPYTVPQDFLFPPQQPPPNYPPPSRPPPQHPPRYPPPSHPPPSLPPSYPPPSHPLPNVLIKQENILDSDQMSIASTATWSTGSAQSAYSSYFDDTFPSPRFSISTANSSLSSGSRLPPGVNFPGLRQPEAPKHDPARGLWNGLRVIPCGKNHSTMHWNVPFVACGICGFSQWHALMIQARTIDVNTFATAMIGLMDICKPDFAGNHTAHFLMAAGVGMEYFTQPLLDLSCDQNAFGQNPLHALDPQDLGEDLISFLQWFKAREHPEGLLLTQRDMKGRTPMHYLLQKPMERHMYPRVLKVFPYEHHQLRTFDTAGRTALMLMNRAALRIKATAPGDYARIQAGIAETKLYQASGDNTQHANTNVYGFHDIARGARGTSYTMAGMPFNFECRICNQSNAHTNSYLDQMLCACKFGRDRNGPDETGMTAAHALVTQERCNNDHRQSAESPAQTAQLLRVLIPQHDTTLREILHVLDRDGNSLTHNIAVRGLDELLQYVLDLENPSRQRAMVNSCSRSPKGPEWSVLAAVTAKFEDTMSRIRVTQVTGENRLRHRLIEKSNRLTKVKHILLGAGAEMNPSITLRWQICWP